jgi:hypothetical protein
MPKQFLISHRGNLNGPDKNTENTIAQIELCINDFYLDVEIDVWLEDKQLFLGHDCPQYPVSLEFLESYKKHLWVHCKNLEALFLLKDICNCFYHDKDDFVLTSRNFIWAYPGKKLTSDSICVLPENHKVTYSNQDLRSCKGICTDYIFNYF